MISDDLNIIQTSILSKAIWKIRELKTARRHAPAAACV